MGNICSAACFAMFFITPATPQVTLCKACVESPASVCVRTEPHLPTQKQFSPTFLNFWDSVKVSNLD